MESKHEDQPSELTAININKPKSECPLFLKYKEGKAQSNAPFRLFDSHVNLISADE